jgi:hypothetical protein
MTATKNQMIENNEVTKFNYRLGKGKKGMKNGGQLR